MKIAVHCRDGFSNIPLERVYMDEKERKGYEEA